MTAALGVLQPVPAPNDGQLVEIFGRNRLVEELLLAGIEVAYPARDRGIDLVAYRDTGTDLVSFIGCPIQVKATLGESFLIDRKYERFPDLLLAFVWNAFDRNASVAFALSYQEALHVATQMGYTETSSWTEQGKYSCTKISGRLRQLLEPYRMTSERWRTKFSSSSNTVRMETLQAGV